MKYIIPITLGFIFTMSSLQASFDHQHSLWGEILQKSISKNGTQNLVKYSILKSDPDQLNSYIEKLSQVSINEFNSFTKDEQLAFLINSYNAFTIKLIINNYPLKSIKDIGSFFSSPWDKDFITLLGNKVNLDHIEHKLIRENFTEPRIHFAVNCASISCPNLSSRPFKSENLSEHLEQMTLAFMQDRAKNNYNESNQRLNLSKIFKWYGSDFDEHYPGGLNYFLAKYFGANSQEVSIIKKGRASKRYLPYDWSLNQAN